MKTNHEQAIPKLEEMLQIIHQAVSKKEFGVVLNIIKPIKRKSDFWELAEKFHQKYGYNFRFELRKEGTEEQNEQLAEFEYRLYNSY
jgi:hypothetical protein